ncbi:MAG: GAF domain-containing protein [Roseiflexaceae bacterium]|nr:GAF domain-containing protein [Roseiflexaceae bacterium]
MSISLYRSIAGQYQQLRHVNSVSMMNTISHLIEEQVMHHDMPINFFTGFQRFSNFAAQQRRYERLAAVCRRVYVFGIPDVRPPRIAGVEFISLDANSPLAREWFLVVDTPDFWTALLTEETDGRDEATGGRRYDGVWSYDGAVVERASLLISQHLGEVFKPVTARNYERQSAHIGEINARMAGYLESSRLARHRQWAQLATLHSFAGAMAMLSPSPLLLMNGCPAHLLQAAVDALQRLFGATSASISLHETGHTYKVVVADGLSVVGRRTIASGEGPTGRAISSGTPILIADALRERERDPLIPDAATLIAAPIIGGRQVYGAITVAGERSEQWSEEDCNTVMSLGRLLAAGIEQRGLPDSSISARLDRAQLIEQALVRLRQPIGHLHSLQQRLRDEGSLNGPQTAVVEQMDALTGTLAQSFGLPPAQLSERSGSKP